MDVVGNVVIDALRKLKSIALMRSEVDFFFFVKKKYLNCIVIEHLFVMRLFCPGDPEARVPFQPHELSAS